MNGADLLRLAKGRKGEFMLTNGTSYVSGTLAVRWVKSYPAGKRAGIKLRWVGGSLTLEGHRSILILTQQIGPTPRSTAASKGYGTNQPSHKSWANALPRLRAEALYLPLPFTVKIKP